MIRRACFNVSITDDDVHESTESFTVVLELEQFVLQSGIQVDPHITEIFIVDNDGKCSISMIIYVVRTRVYSSCSTGDCSVFAPQK